MFVIISSWRKIIIFLSKTRLKFAFWSFVVIIMGIGINIKMNLIMRKKIKRVAQKIRKTIPVKIRSISFSLALFMLGWWLGTDTYFSIYIKEIIGNARWVTIIWSFLAFVKLLFVVPIWRMNDKLNIKYILLMWKILYVFCGLLFFLAWIFHSWILLTIATILNWFANATTFTTYRSYYAKKSTKSDNSQIAWIYFSANYITEVIWSLIAAFLVSYLELPYMYLFVVIFSLVSLMQDQNIKAVLSSGYNKTWKRFYKRVKKESKTTNQIKQNWNYDQGFFGKGGFIHSFVNGCLSAESWKEIWWILCSYGWKMYVALWSCMLTNFLNYISFLFIPIVAAENHLSLSQIALVFAAMKLPYIVNVFTWKFGDKYSKKLLISIILVFVSCLYFALWFVENFYAIMILTFFISLWIAVLYPITSALVVSYTKPKDKWSMTWVQDFVSKLWEIIWSLGFWALTAIIWLKKWFVIIWFCTFGLWWYLLIKKLLSYKSRNNEREKIKSNEIYELPIPVVDVVSGFVEKKD